MSRDTVSDAVAIRSRVKFPFSMGLCFPFLGYSDVLQVVDGVQAMDLRPPVPPPGGTGFSFCLFEHLM